MRQILLVFLAFICGLSATAQHRVQRLQDVKTIYVAPWDGDNAAVANLIGAKLVSYLAKYHGVAVVENPDNADAVLMGAGLTQSQTNNYGRISYHVQAALRLDNKDGLVLWADDVSNSMFARSATSSFAENVAKALVKAIFSDNERR